jgi:hypothetical protein
MSTFAPSLQQPAAGSRRSGIVYMMQALNQLWLLMRWLGGLIS